MDIRFDLSLLPSARTSMDRIDAAWRQASGAKSRAEYSIFYAPFAPSPLMVLNLNPGGASSDYRLADVANGASEFVEGHGPTVQNTGRLLRQALRASSAEGIRGIQGSNVIWCRSPNLKSLAMRTADAARETAPHLARYIADVGPRALLFGGNAAFTTFVASHRARILAEGEQIMGPNGSNSALYFGHSTLSLPYLPNPVETFVVLHPSKGLRDIAVAKLQTHFTRLLAI